LDTKNTQTFFVLLFPCDYTLPYAKCDVSYIKATHSMSLVYYVKLLFEDRWQRFFYNHKWLISLYLSSSCFNFAPASVCSFFRCQL